MGILTSLIPWPYRILAMVLLVVTCLASAYVKGRIDEARVCDQKNAASITAATKVLVKTEKVIQRVVVQSKSNEAHIEADGRDALKQAQTDHDNPNLPDRGCVVAPVRMRNILNAWGLPPGPGQDGVPAVVPEAAPAEKRSD